VAVSSHWLVNRGHPELLASDQREPILHEDLVLRLPDGVVGLAEGSGIGNTTRTTLTPKLAMFWLRKQCVICFISQGMAHLSNNCDFQKHTTKHATSNSQGSERHLLTTVQQQCLQNMKHHIVGEVGDFSAQKTTYPTGYPNQQLRLISIDFEIVITQFAKAPARARIPYN
jgi:hypothetical protein